MLIFDIEQQQDHIVYSLCWYLLVITYPYIYDVLNRQHAAGYKTDTNKHDQSVLIFLSIFVQITYYLRGEYRHGMVLELIRSARLCGKQ